MSQYAILIKLSGYQRILHILIHITVNHLAQTPPVVLIVKPVPTPHTSRVSSPATVFHLHLYATVIHNVQTEKTKTSTLTTVIKNTLRTILSNPTRHTVAKAHSMVDWKFMPLLVIKGQNVLMDQGRVSKL